MAEYGFNYSGLDTEDAIARIQKDLNYIMNNLDHNNVRRLYTEYCDVKSEKGETIIDGPLLTMRSAASTTIRLLQGYDASTGQFVFKLFNSTGNEVVGLSAVGDGVITGGTIRTASTGERIEMSGNSFRSYNSSNHYAGLNFGSTFTGFGDLHFYDDGIEVLQFYNNLTGAGYTIKPMNGAGLYLGGPSTSFVYLNSTSFYSINNNSTSLFITKGYVQENFAANMSWNSGTRTLTLTDGKGNTITSVVIST